jgi:hypothetical protein
MDLDIEAQSPEGEVSVKFWPIDGPLLARQLEYFEYALQLLYYLHAQYSVNIGKETSHEIEEPKSIAQPPRYIQAN